MPSAAIFHKKVDEIAKAIVIGAVDDRARFAPRCNQARTFQFFQMERDVRRRDSHLVCDKSGGHAFFARLDETTDNAQPRLLRQRGETNQRLTFVNNSIILEL